MLESLTLKVKEYARKIGADLVGIANSELLENPDPGCGHIPPSAYLKGCKAIIVIGLAHTDICTQYPEFPVEDLLYQDVYCNEYHTINTELDRIAYKIARFMETNGYNAVSIPASSPFRRSSKPLPKYDRFYYAGISHRYAAYCAGLGAFGVSSLLLTPEFGPRVRFVCVLTDAPLEHDKPYKGKVCTRCNACVEACPSGAITPVVDPSDAENVFKNYNQIKCVYGMRVLRDPVYPKIPPESLTFEYLTNNILSRPTPSEMQAQYTIYVPCGICMKVCKVGKTSNKKRIPEKP
ncbi:MAG: 4Fe-4S binding protein [Candidatus Bathyarchaeia archaeon]